VKTFRTLFSGGELFGAGARAAGWQHLDGYEIDERIAAVARLNGFDVRTIDVCQVDYDSLPPADHLHASPSCKHASQANTQAGETDEDRTAADAVCRAVRAHQGATVSLENVWGYRTFESFRRILATLKACGFVVDFRHINAADYGVPQTRKRLILRAVRGSGRVPPLHPTHRKGGDMFHAPWIGWYAAIADLIPTLPATELAPWQLARLPAELRETMLLSGAMANGADVVTRSVDEPAVTVVAAEITKMPVRAYLIGSGGYNGLVTQRLRDEPCFTVTSTHESQVIRALLVQSKNTSQEWGDGYWVDEQPAPTVVSDHKPSHMPRAYLLDGDNARADTGEQLARIGTEPAMTLRGSRTTAQRAYVGRWVRLTVRALGRFQTVPDSYVSLTAEINGNAVPPLLAQRIMESLLPAYER
jgi:DNA (cytosine-5)-methyltransferase 1